MSARAFRIGTEPQIDEELATKFYVDNSSGGGGGKLQFASSAWRAIGASTFYWSWSGRWFFPSSNEQDFKQVYSVAFTFETMTERVTTNTLSGTRTTTARIDGVDGNQIIVVSSATTGVFRDLVNTDSKALDEVINLKVVSVGSGTSTWGGSSIEAELL